ncbi:MAG: hypothetical protein I8H75_02370 [Myxococcaceae bacterium]|nr:hypothetical protein [Myxococcaceae bacterium]MBH2006180.1 hypothetical protein [Myxococcaceae bacterium]
MKSLFGIALLVPGAWVYGVQPSRPQENSTRVIELGEVQIHGDVDRSNVNFVLPRAQFDFLRDRPREEPEDIKEEILKTAKYDIFKVE